MATFTMMDLWPKQFISPLKVLGRYEWLKWRSVDTSPPSTAVTLAIPEVAALEEHRPFIELVKSLSPSANGELFALYARSKFLADGPKLLRPTTAQCEALEHVEVNVAFDEYEQPFPAYLVEIPEPYRRLLSARFNCRCPKFVLNWHHKQSGYILSICEVSLHMGSTFSLMSPRPCWRTIEDALRLYAVEDGPDLRQGEILYRVAITFGLLLTRFGARDVGPIDPKYDEKLRRLANKKNKRKAQRARELLDATVNLVELEQNVVFCDVAKIAEADPEANGRMKRPHWRRGHFRRQRHGIGHSKHKLIFVRPCFINAELCRGDLADTRYQISMPPKNYESTTASWESPA